MYSNKNLSFDIIDLGLFPNAAEKFGIFFGAGIDQLPTYILFENASAIARLPELNFEAKASHWPTSKISVCSNTENLYLVTMVLFTSKLSRRGTTITPSALYFLLVHGNWTTLQNYRHQLKRAYSSFRFISSCLAYPFRQASSVGLHNRIAFQRKSLSDLAGTVLVQARDPASLVMKMQIALDEHRICDAWTLYEQCMQMDGFPRKSVVNKILATFAESLDARWLEKAFGLVQQACEEGKENLLEKETLIYLSFSLAKSGLAVPASTVLRTLVKMEQFPPVAAWSVILAHISQTAAGAYLAAELVLEIGCLFEDNRVDPRKKSNAPLIAMKPDTSSFNIALAGCLLFGTTKKAEELLEMMPRVGVKLNSDLLIVMATIYERNGRREELRKLQQHINDVHNLNESQFLQFQSCLLTCHLKLGDLDSASNMVLDMLRKKQAARSSVAATSLVIDGIGNERKSFPVFGSMPSVSHEKPNILKDKTRNPMVTFKEYSRDRNFVKLETEAKEVLAAMLAKLQNQVQLLTTERGIIQPTDKIFVKLIKVFLEAGKTKDLAQFLIKAEKEDCPVSNDDSVLVHVITSCISLGWLDQAHDLLDEMRLAGVRSASSVYSSLLKAYCRENRAGEAASLLRDARRAGIQLDSSCYQALMQSNVLHHNTQEAFHLFKEMKEAKIPKTGHQGFGKLIKGCSEGVEPKLMSKLLQEITDGQKVDCGVHDWNNVIHFFARKRLMQDAEKALKKMLSLGHAPNAQTFHSMVIGYAAIGGSYIEVAELWGEMKSLVSSTTMKFDQELLDSVLYTFVRGGFFNRANEVVEIMEKGKMFVDKYKYRTLFLKYHKTLYKGKAPKFQTESQLRKREAALAFKRWVGLN